MTDSPSSLSFDFSADGDRLTGILEFFQATERLKDTIRSGCTRSGRAESTAEHSWRLALMVLLFERELDGVDLLKLIKLCLVHDLGEAISGDVPAPLQKPDDNRLERERQDFQTLCAPLPEDLRLEFVALWEEYATAQTPEARFAKAFDKLETMLQHLLMPQQDAAFYEFNLDYGRKQTDFHSLTRQIRGRVDARTRERAGRAANSSS